MNSACDGARPSRFPIATIEFTISFLAGMGCAFGDLWMAAGIDFDQEPRGFEGVCAQLEFLCYCAEPGEFSCRKRKKRERNLPLFEAQLSTKVIMS